MEKELTTFFMTFSGMKFSRDTPVLAILFEGQTDPQIAEHFPELEARRESTDKILRKGDQTLAVQTILREEKPITLGMVYIKYPWKKRKEFDLDSIIFLREVWNRMVSAILRIREEGFKKIIILMPDQFSPQKVQDKKQRQQLYLFVRAVTEAVVYANKPYDEHVTEPDKKLEEVTFVFFGESQPALDGFLRTALGDGICMGDALAFTRRLTELAPNLKPPLEFVRQAVGRDLQVRTRNGWQDFSLTPRTSLRLLYGRESLQSQGFELICGVAAASEHEPCFLKVHYKPKTKRQKRVRTVALTGKGVTFDSGGMNIKGTDYYLNMHYDVAGAATIFGVIRVAEEKNLPVEIVGLIPVVENAIGSKAITPGTILKAYGGKTVQVTNTDCEGRLLMAEAIVFAERRIKPDAIVTVATLGDMTDFGPDFLKLVVTNKMLERKARVAEHRAAEKVFLFPPVEYLNLVDDMHISPNADIMNNVPECYHVSPVIFMYNFFVNEPNWVLLDISSVLEDWAPMYGAGPGFGLKFLWHLLEQFS